MTRDRVRQDCALIAVLGTAIVYGTDAFCAMVEPEQSYKALATAAVCLALNDLTSADTSLHRSQPKG